MAGWYGARSRSRSLPLSARAVIAMVVLALALIGAVPVALVAAVLMMLLGHVIGGLALFGGSILAAMAAVVLAGLSGTHYLRRVITERSFRVLQLGSQDYTYVG